MSFPPRDIVKFGERDHRELRVDPQYGQAGTSFHFRAFHFKPHQRVRAVIKGPKHYIVYNHELDTDDSGSIDYIELHLVAAHDWPRGAYTFSVDDKEATFEIK